MFGLANRPAKTRGRLMRKELGESWEHFLQAATHAANGMGTTIGPATGKMRGAATRGWESTSTALAPLAEAYRAGVHDAEAVATKARKRLTAQKKEKRMSRNRVGMLVGLLAAGAAVGAAGALVMRRRKHRQWSEYDPSEALESVRSDARSMVDRVGEKTEDVLDKATTSASRTMDKTADKLRSAASSLSKNKEEMKSKTSDAAERVNDVTDDFTSRVSSASKNSRP